MPRSSNNQWVGRKLLERESIARSFVAKAVYGFPFTRSPLRSGRERSAAERFNSCIKEEFGASNSHSAGKVDGIG